ncbi:MAG: hypothetical protein D4R80_00950 [Deltaproteobacteria bacterium]|nr:MAG: hypothetical protein D4R80_00950 [Deltaproteobacteria bacterium]
MTHSFKDIMVEATEMFNISTRMAEEEIASKSPDEIVVGSLMELAKSCKGLMREAKKRAEEIV